MKEAIGNAGLIGIAMFIIGAIIAIFVGSLNYTKAFKVKNRIVDIIEQYNSGYSKANRNTIDKEIDAVLRDLGYRIDTSNRGCPQKQNATLVHDSRGTYRYCIYEKNDKRGDLYIAVSYMYFDLPVIGGFMEFPVSGETKVFYHNVDVN